MNITWNPNDKGSAVTLSSDLLEAHISSRYNGLCRATLGKIKGKWYWEIQITYKNSSSAVIGIANKDALLSEGILGYGVNKQLSAGYHLDGTLSKIVTDNVIGLKYNSTWNVSDIFGIALDLDNKTIILYQNGQIITNSAINIGHISGAIYPAVGAWYGTSDIKIKANFGTTTFKYSPPQGYNAYSDSSKFLIKQNGFYYSIKQEYYDDGAKTFLPIQLAGGTVPNTQDIEIYSFEDMNNLIIDTIVNQESFKPIDKLSNIFEMKTYLIK